MIELDAQKKWCPFVRLSLEENGTMNNRAEWTGHDPSPITRCIASECMAWRWNDKEGRVVETGKPVLFDGYCGLAGKPEVD